MEDIYHRLEEKLKSQSLPARILAGMFNFPDDRVRKSNEYLDPRYLPFYYYLGCELSPRNVVAAGGPVGLLPATFLIGCKSVENLLVFAERTARANVKKNYRGNLHMQPTWQEELLASRLWDLAIVDDPNTIDMAWAHLAENGILCVERARGCQQLTDFSFIKQRESRLFQTRYGTSLLVK